MLKRKSTEVLGLVSIREILRLRSQGMSGNRIDRIAQSVNVSRSVVQDYEKLSVAVGLSYERACELS